MRYPESTPFHRLLATKYNPAAEVEAIRILDEHPELAQLEWPGPDRQGQPFVAGSTALHYAANDGKVRLIERLVRHGADVNASNANWFRSVLAWAANNARVDAIRRLLDLGASPHSLDALHAAAWGGSDRGASRAKDHAEAIEILVGAGADVNDRRHSDGKTPLAVALASDHPGAIERLRSLGGVES